MFLLRPPGVYRPQRDSWLLAKAVRTAVTAPGARVLDVCTGTGLLALLAARAGAARVTAVDLSRRAAWTTRANAALHGLPVRVLRGDLFAPVAGELFDVIVSNPPYVLSDGGRRPRGAGRAWDAGHDGRVLLDRICREAPHALAPGGVLLLAHSALCDTDETLRRLRDAGLTAAAVDRVHEPFGPVLRSRAHLLRARGLIGVEETMEELVVVRAQRP